MYFSLFDWNYVYFGDYLGKIISISDIVTVDLSPLFLHKHIFILNVNVASEHKVLCSPLKSRQVSLEAH